MNDTAFLAIVSCMPVRQITITQNMRPNHTSASRFPSSDYTLTLMSGMTAIGRPLNALFKSSTLAPARACEKACNNAFPPPSCSMPCMPPTAVTAPSEAHHKNPSPPSSLLCCSGRHEKMAHEEHSKAGSVASCQVISILLSRPNRYFREQKHLKEAGCRGSTREQRQRGGRFA